MSRDITSVKIEGTPAGPKTSEVLALSDNRMDVFGGWGGLSFWEGLQRGAKGCMPAANFGPPLAEVYELYQGGDYAAALSRFDGLVPFVSWAGAVMFTHQLRGRTLLLLASLALSLLRSALPMLSRCSPFLWLQAHLIPTTMAGP